MSETVARGGPLAQLAGRDVTFGPQPLPTPSRVTVTPAVALSNASLSTPVAVASADSAPPVGNVSPVKKSLTSCNVQTRSQQEFIQRPGGGPGTPVTAPHDGLPSDPVSMIPLLQARSSEADAFQKLLKKYLIGQVFVIQSRVLLYTTRSQGERSVYCVELTTSMPQGAYFSTMVTPSHEFRNPVVKMVDLSQGPHIRVGMLLSDCSFHISVFDPVAFRWPKKGFVYTKFVHLPTHLPADDASTWNIFGRQIVYSPTCDMLFWTRIDTTASTDTCRPPTWKLVMYDLINRFEKPLMSLPGPAVLTPLTHELGVLLRNYGVIFVDYTSLCLDQRLTRVDLSAGDGPGCSWQDARRNAPQQLGCSYWHPESNAIEFVPVRTLRPRVTQEQLEGFCPCKESRPSFALKKNLLVKEAGSGKKSALALAASVPILSVVILYGGILFRLSGQVCAPLLRINIPAAVREPFYHVLYRDRVVVLHSSASIIIYLTRENTFRIIKGHYIVAGQGVVCSPTHGSVTKIRIQHEVVDDGPQTADETDATERPGSTQPSKSSTSTQPQAATSH